MLQRITSPKRLQHRRPRLGHPFARRLSHWRKSITLALLIMLLMIIGGYWYLTDSDRVRLLAQGYLTQVMGGPVSIRKATLSIFEGLRLDGVSVRVDDADLPDSVIFTAETFRINLDPTALIRGGLEAMQIVAIDPHVRLTENVDTGRWNYQRLMVGRPSATQPGQAKSSQPAVSSLPEILLRNAVIDYSDIHEGTMRSMGSLAIEGRLSPLGDNGRYSFDLQSRGQLDGSGPQVTGVLSLETGRVQAKLKNFEFGRDIRTMLPAQVRQWWEDHELSGQLEVPQLIYNPSPTGGKPSFVVKMVLNGVTLSVRSEEWMGRAEKRQLQSSREAFALMRRMGINGGVAEGMVDRLAGLFEPARVRLEKVNGSFEFTEYGLDIQQIRGLVDKNMVQVTGRIDGYSPEATARLRIESVAGEKAYIPRDPKWVNSLPSDVREIWDHIRPEGVCQFWTELKRTVAGEDPTVVGELTPLEASCHVDYFPYPLRKVTGLIKFGREADGKDWIRLVQLKGLGVADGPNRDRIVLVDGFIGPLDGGPEFNIIISGQGITSEPALLAAMPTDARKALRIFGPSDIASGKKYPPEVEAGYPKFHGDFVCRVLSEYGRGKKVYVPVDIHIDDAEGAMRVFPYPLKHAQVDLQIRNDYLKIVRASIERSGASVNFAGEVSWGKDKPAEPKIQVTAKNVPIDQDLLRALPQEQGNWMRKAGLQGTLDLDGRIGFIARESAGSSVQKAEPEIGFDLNIALRNGSVSPDGKMAAGDVAGQFRLLPDQLQIIILTAKRGEAQLEASGLFSWPNDRPAVAVRAAAKNLLLDPALEKLLPKEGREAWEQVNPQGTVDVELSYNGLVGAVAEKGDSAMAMKDQFELTIRPRKLACKVKTIPYRLQDLTGSLNLHDGLVKLTEIHGRHGEAEITIDGIGRLAAPMQWELKLSGSNVPVDEEFRTAVPAPILTILAGLKVKGNMDFTFSKLNYREEAAAKEGADVDFVSKVTMSGGELSVGVPMQKVVGSVDVAGAVRKGGLAELSGKVQVESLSLAGRAMRNLKANLRKAVGEEVLRVGNIRGELAGGELAGEVNLVIPDSGPSRYSLSLDLRGAEIRQITQESDYQIEGQLEANLALEGNWESASSRRGGGRVQVAGKRMYRVPVLLGLMQVTNLSIPLSEPFNEGSARYVLDGNTVTIEQLELRSPGMLMQGHGSLDFATKKVNMWFATDNPKTLNVPFISDLYSMVKKELIPIRVTGSITEPKVLTQFMGTFTTTVEQVFKGTEPLDTKRER